MRFTFAFAGLAIGALALVMPAVAHAKGPRGGKTTHAMTGSKPHGWSRGKKTGWRGASTPPGWSKGPKTGWGGQMMPPGLLRLR